MVGFLSLVLSLAAFVGTVVGVNIWYSPLDAPVNYDIAVAQQHLEASVLRLGKMPPCASWTLSMLYLLFPTFVVYVVVRRLLGKSPQ